MNNKFFSMPFKTFTPENLLQEMLNAKEGEVFILGKSTLRSRIGRLRSLGVKVPKAQLDAVRLSKLEIAQLNSIVIKWQKEQDKEHLL